MSGSQAFPRAAREREANLGDESLTCSFVELARVYFG